MVILGISAYFHDSAACIIRDGEIIAAAQEERFTRRKHDPNFPSSSVKYCIAKAEVKNSEIDFIVYYEKPFLKFERLLESYLAFAPRGFSSFSKALPSWVKDKLFLKRKLTSEIESITGLPKDVIAKKLLFNEHHMSHAASAFYPSPFERAAVITLDGVGEWATSTISVGRANKINILKQLNFPHSLGLLYSAFTFHTGFRVNSGEYKLMGLAPFGEPKYTEIIKEHVVNIADDGSFTLDMKYFDYGFGLKMTSNEFSKLFGRGPRKPETKIEQLDMDLAASIQKVTEEIVLKIARYARELTSEKYLCLSGGVALNCVANGKIIKENIFDDVWIQPASGDAGGALGAALSAYYQFLNKSRDISPTDSMKGSYLGPEFSDSDIMTALKKAGAIFQKLPEQQILKKTAEEIAKGSAVGWMQGRMEFGPRALGNRSILGDPRNPKTQQELNLKVKFRESFRPFAPSVLAERSDEWFNLSSKSPYMLLVAPINENKQKPAENNGTKGLTKVNDTRSDVPAVTHVDYSARFHTVDKFTNPKFRSLLENVNNETGCPVLVNTSFNVRGEPIVCSPADAYRCFMATNLDILVINDFWLEKGLQPNSISYDYINDYELD